MQIKKGTVLPNGATVIQKKGDIVLARFKGEFVTWAVDNYGNCSSGRYYLKESEAKKSFERRSK